MVLFICSIHQFCHIELTLKLSLIEKKKNKTKKKKKHISNCSIRNNNNDLKNNVKPFKIFGQNLVVPIIKVIVVLNSRS